MPIDGVPLFAVIIAQGRLTDAVAKKKRCTNEHLHGIYGEDRPRNYGVSMAGGAGHLLYNRGHKRFTRAFYVEILQGGESNHTGPLPPYFVVVISGGESLVTVPSRKTKFASFRRASQLDQQNEIITA
ncbi:hypothetical protein QE152_g30430 [Popillia japonica]|uniref:Uncharacterized protein n=1 Tax=Popillia japonica TaxID=7064 RepID=A0AAW1JFS8_POPJA